MMLLAIIAVIMLAIIFSIYDSTTIPLSTDQRKELCILEKELKYPTAANYTINRLCYLEELGRSSVA